MTIPATPTRKPTSRRLWIAPAAFAAGGLILGATITGSIVATNYETRVDHCVGALDTSGAAMYAAGDAIEAAGNFDIYGLETAAADIENLNDAQFELDVNECRGNQ